MKTLTALALTVLFAGPLAAQGWIEPPPERWPGFGVVKVRTAVSVRVTGRVALVEVEEWFRNDGRGLGEGDYLYPLPGEAVFSNYSLFQGDQELRGETMDAGQARAIYEEIVRRKKDPALIELVGHGLIRARVFPINQGETRKITLRYTQVLERAGDALQFRYAAGGRYSGVIRREGATNPSRQTEPAPLSFTLTADSADQYRDPFSPTHQVQVTRDDGRLRVRPTSDLSGDFALFLPLARSLVGITVATHRPIGEDGYFMFTLSPGRPDGSVLPRDITVVLDMLKITIPTLVFKHVYPDTPYFLITAATGMIGHVWPLYHGFKGGRGSIGRISALWFTCHPDPISAHMALPEGERHVS